MKQTIFVALILAICCSHNTKKVDDYGVTFNVKIDTIAVNRLFLKASLINNRSDTFKYAITYCNWEVFYKTNTRKVNIYCPGCSIGCDKSGPRIIEIPPNKSVVNDIEISSLGNIIDLKGFQFKVGFNYVSPNKIQTRRAAEDSPYCSQLVCPDWKKVIWSNPITIQ